MALPNTVLEDISAEVGFNSASALAGWFGGRIVWVPGEASPGHEIAKVIGFRSFERLVKVFGGQRVFIPKGELQISTMRRRRAVRDLLRDGKSSAEIAAAVGLTRMQIINIRRDLESQGFLPAIFKEPPEMIDEPVDERFD